MGTNEILREIKKLPVTDRITITEKILKSILADTRNIMEHASEVLYDDYKNDKELTAFTSIDLDKFYEAK